MVFRRASRTIILCEDALAFQAEARRRVKRFRDSGGSVTVGDRILILGEDENGKTDDLHQILIKVDATFARINAEVDSSVTVRLLAPNPASSDETDEEIRAKNRSSTIIQLSLTGDGVAGKGMFLTGGDAEVAIWERLWQKHQQQPEVLSYNLLQTPHHCSWHSLSWDSWSEKREDAKVSGDARAALSQTLPGAVLIASSKPIEDDDDDPPSVGAKREYEKIADDSSGDFKCVGSDAGSEPMEFEVGRNGLQLKTQLITAPAIVTGGAVGRDPLPHG
jgi:hypothetical protein